MTNDGSVEDQALSESRKLTSSFTLGSACANRFQCPSAPRISTGAQLQYFRANAKPAAARPLHYAEVCSSGRLPREPSPQVPRRPTIRQAAQLP